MIHEQIYTKKNHKNNINKKHLWNIFDTEFIIQNKPLECIYRAEGERELCEYCSTSLIVTDEGYMVCQNPKCGILYKDMLDQSAEWRYFGADDNQQGDPTRCGMPINPLLKESSFGCKVITSYPSSYEMRKIRRYTEW